MFEELLELAWGLYDRFAEYEFVYKPSFPILFFGDSQRYFKSDIRVVTVGLNPSEQEFRSDRKVIDQFFRFPAARNIHQDRVKQKYEKHEKALNDYFKNSPYTNWFCSFEPFLNAMDCSFYEINGKKNSALHTDLFSPLATTPAWSQLRKNNPFKYVRAELEQEGLALWHKLIELLEPDVLVISVAREYLKKIRFLDLNSSMVFCKISNKLNNTPRRKKYEFELMKGTVICNEMKIVFGEAANTPFGTVSNLDKEKAGRILCSLL